jgi:hypothetical protein
LRELEPALESVAVDFGTMYQHVLEFSHKLEELQHEMNRVKNRAYILWKSIRGRLLHLYSSDSGSALGAEDIIRGLHADYEEWNREVENASRLRAEESAAVNLCARAINDLGEPHQQVLSSAQLARREARGQAAPPDPSRPMSLAWLGAISCAHQAGLFSHVLEDLGIDAQSVVDDSWTAPHGELVMIAVAAY